MDHNATLAYASGLELHHPNMSMIGGNIEQLEREIALGFMCTKGLLIQFTPSLMECDTKPTFMLSTEYFKVTTLLVLIFITSNWRISVHNPMSQPPVRFWK